MKTCFKCQRAQPIAEFYVHPQMGDGHLGKCKDCTKRDSALRRLRKLADPEWLKHERARCVAKQTRYGRIVREKWPEKYRARIAVQNARKRGALVKPSACERCCRQLPARRIQAHHEDYGRPLDVTWVCAPCHAALEGRLKFTADPAERAA